MGCDAIWPEGASAGLQRCGDTSLFDYQSAVRSALATDDWIHGKRAEVGWTELKSARLQHLVSTAEIIFCRNSFPGIVWAVAPSDRCHRHQGLGRRRMERA